MPHNAAGQLNRTKQGSNAIELYVFLCPFVAVACQRQMLWPRPAWHGLEKPSSASACHLFQTGWTRTGCCHMLSCCTSLFSSRPPTPSYQFSKSGKKM